MAHSKGDPGRWAQEYLHAGDLAVDIGASQGTYTREMSRLVGPTGSVIAIDPEPSAAQTDWPSNVRFLPVACGRVPDPARAFYVHRQARSRSSFWPHPEPDSFEASTPVAVHTLDSLVGTQSVQLVKIDVQGAEVEVLDGALATLRQCPIWILEAWPYGLHEAGASIGGLLDRCRRAGLTVFWADGPEVCENAEVAEWIARGLNGNPHEHVNWLARRAS